MARRLAAILAADVVGYSRLMSEDEAGTLRAVKTHQKEVFDPEVARHGGRIVKLMGDGVLVEFPSVVEAVQCAIAVQDKLAAAPETWIKLRIGVTLGDIIIDADDIFGNGVNVAARLQEMAEPGGICISGTVFEQVEGKVDHRFVDLGTQQIRNIPKPVHVYGDFARVMTSSREAKAGLYWMLSTIKPPYKQPAAACAVTSATKLSSQSSTVAIAIAKCASGFLALQSSLG